MGCSHPHRSHARCGIALRGLRSVLDEDPGDSLARASRPWHAGRCRHSDPRLGYRDANSAFYGIAAATNDKVDVTPLQTLTVAYLTRQYFASEGWPLADLWRVTSHRLEAWKRGRKSDPEGGDLKNPILAVEDILQLLGKIEL